MLKKNLYTIWLFGAISGFTIMVSGNTLNFWLSTEKIDIRTIGIFALISIPYAINFIWAPIFDLKRVPYLSNYLGKRTSWVCIIQIFLGIFIIFLSFASPTDNLFLFSLFSLIVSFFSAAQDTVLGALRTEIIPKETQGEASGIYIFGYRIGMLMSGSGAIYLSEYLSWGKIYLIFGLITLVYPIYLILLLILKKSIIEEPLVINNLQARKNFLSSFFEIIRPIRFIFLIIIFLILYRLPDNFINVMINPFLLHLGYSAKQIATTGKFFGVLTAIIGGLIASRIMKKKTIVDSLLIFGIIHTLAHSLFIVQEIYGKNIYLLFFVISFESITGGMTMAAYIAFIASLCQGKFRATQYSFLTSMMGLSRSIFPAISGYIVVDYGWRSFFAFTVAASLPSIWLISKISNKLESDIKAL